MIHLALMAVAIYVIVCVGFLLIPYAVGALMFGVPLLAVGFLYSWLCRPLGATGAAGVIFGGGLAIALLVDGAQRYRRRRARALALR
jgi:hypothetical protein